MGGVMMCNVGEIFDVHRAMGIERGDMCQLDAMYMSKRAHMVVKDDNCNI